MTLRAFSAPGTGLLEEFSPQKKGFLMIIRKPGPVLCVLLTTFNAEKHNRLRKTFLSARITGFPFLLFPAIVFPSFHLLLQGPLW